LTVDPGGQDKNWTGWVGFIPEVLTQLKPSPENAVSILCGPPAMIKFGLVPLSGSGFAAHQIMISLEKKIKCGVGKCGRCNVGRLHVCEQGPIFSYEQLRELPDEY
jgi:NAD(P)H-flavin reductase